MRMYRGIGSGAVLVALLALVALAPSQARAQAPCVPPQQLGVVFVLDDSGSMVGSDPQKLRGTMVDLGLRQLGAGRLAAAVTFATEATTVFGPTAITDQNIGALSGQVGGALKSTGGTDYDKAFTAALAQLNAMPASVDRKAVIFLSDGQPNGPFTSDQSISGVPIYTVGFGDAPEAVLQDIAYRHGGQSFAAPDAGAAQAVAARIVSSLTCQTVQPPEVVEIPPGGTREIPFDVPKGTSKFTALATWSQAGQVVGRLVRPDSSVLGPGAAHGGETFEEGPTFMRATATNPPNGTWKLRLSVSGASPQSVRVTIDVLGGGEIDTGLNERPKPDAPGCETEVKVAGRTAWSRCFKQRRGVWTTTRPMRVNGIDIEPVSGDVKLLRHGRVDARNALVSIRSSGPLLPDGRLDLYQGELSLPLRGSTVLGLESNPPKGEHRRQQYIGGLPLGRAANAELGWTESGAQLKVSLMLGGDFLTLLSPEPRPGDPGQHRRREGPTLKRGVGLEATLATSNERGLAVDRLHGFLDTGKLWGALAIKRLSLSYDGKDNLWVGGATIVPFEGPLARYALPDVSAELGIRVHPKLEFGSLKVTVTDIQKPLGCCFYLQKIGGGITRIPEPFTITGEMGFSLGPKFSVPTLGEMALAELEGSAEYKWPAAFKASAGLTVLRQKMANAHLEVNASEPSAVIGGDLNVAIAGNGIDGRLDGWIKGGKAQLYGAVAMKVFDKTVTGSEGFLSSRGIGACRRGWGPDYGFTVEFNRSLPGALRAMAVGCDFGDLVLRTQPSAAQAGQAFSVRSGSPGMLLRVRGAGGQPAVAVTGPGGARYEIPVNVPFIESPPRFTAIRDEANNDLWVVLNAPAAGNWSVQPLPGSAPLAPLATAGALPEPRLRVSVRRAKGGRRVLRWRARRINGQRIAFVERGPGGVVREVLTTRRSSGRKRFRPAIGSGGTRTIEATVLNNGTPRTVVPRAARYRTGTVRPARPRRVGVRQSGSRIVVSWTGAAGAARYLVTARLRDGRRIEQWMGRRARRLTVHDMPRRTRGRFTVRSVARSGMRSLPAQRTLRVRRRR
jgi:hypothetical protein